VARHKWRFVLADTLGMWTYVLRHHLLLRAIYARSTPVVD
jgi:hypothetical protein